MMTAFKRVTTCVLDAQDLTAVPAAAAAIRRGQLVVLPTDTVYGVGTTPWHGEAIIALYTAKVRPAEKGIPILLADVADVAQVAREVPAAARPLIERFWPGPLTLVLPRRAELPSELAPGDTVAVRIPDHELSRAIIRAAGGAVATTSANRSGSAAAQTAEEALAQLAGAVELIIDAGPSPQGHASTVVDCTTAQLRILRVGPLTAVDLGLEGK